MPIAEANSTPDRLYVGNRLVQRAYYSDTLVYKADPPFFTVQGDTFNPWIQLAPGSTATVEWVDDSNNTVLSTSLTPTINWGVGSGTHHVRLECTIPGDITMLNLGFRHDQDEGIYTPGATYNWPTQPVTAIADLQSLTGLVQFMAARTNGASEDELLYTGPVLSGSLNFSGMAHLQFIECYAAQIQTVTIEGCSSLIRLCFEACAVTYLDLNPVLSTLRDLRAARQTGGTLQFATLQGPLVSLYHFCVRDQIVVNPPNFATQMPIVSQLWIWNCGLSGTLEVNSSAGMHTIHASGNRWTAVNLAGVTWGGWNPYLNGASQLSLYDSFLGNSGRITSLNLGSINPSSGLWRIRMNSCGLSTALVDYILNWEVNTNTHYSGNIEVTGIPNNPPSAAGYATAQSIVANGGSVSITNPLSTTGWNLAWQDEFNGAAGPVGGGWSPYGGDLVVGNLDGSGGLVLTTTSEGYRRFTNPAGSLPANVAVELDFTRPLTFSEAFWGLAARLDDANGSGAKILFTDANSFREGNSNVSSGSPRSFNNIPQGWTGSGAHTLRFELVGTSYRVFADGYLVTPTSLTNTTNSALTGGHIAIIGEPRGRIWNAVRVYTVVP